MQRKVTKYAEVLSEKDGLAGMCMHDLAEAPYTVLYEAIF